MLALEEPPMELDAELPMLEVTPEMLDGAVEERTLEMLEEATMPDKDVSLGLPEVEETAWELEAPETLGETTDASDTVDVFDVPETFETPD